jgi:hypothetical protein
VLEPSQEESQTAGRQGAPHPYRQEVIGLSEAVARFASRMHGGIALIKLELDKLTAE